MTTASNIGMIDSTYEIGITQEYAELIDYNIYYDIDKREKIYLRGQERTTWYNLRRKQKPGAKELGITSEYAELISYNIYYDIDKSDNIL